MFRTSTYAFSQAKIYGILAKSFLGIKYRELAALRRIADLHDRLFPGAQEQVPESLLAASLQKKILQQSVMVLVSVLDLFPRPHPFLIHLLRKYDLLNLKSWLRRRRRPAPEPAFFFDLGAYGELRFDGEPEDIEKGIRGSRYAWLLETEEKTPFFKIENRLDLQYYRSLVEIGRSLPSADRRGVMRLLNREIALGNVLWALRLCFYFGLGLEESRELLLPPDIDPFCPEAENVFLFKPDDPAQWREWRYASLVEEQLSGEMEGIDPARAETRANLELYRLCRTLFHRYLFTLTPFTAFFKLKELEAGVLLTLSEGIRLGSSEEEILSTAGMLP